MTSYNILNMKLDEMLYDIEKAKQQILIKGLNKSL